MSHLDLLTDPLALAFAASGSHQDAIERESAFDSIAQGKRRAVIFGCGPLGRVTLAGARNAGMEVAAFADNQPAHWGRVIDGVEVLSPAAALAAYNECAVFIVGIFNGSQVRAQLRDLRCHRVASFPLFFWRFPDCFPQETGLELPHRILEQTDAIARGYGLLADSKSRNEFAAQIQWRCTLDDRCLPPHDPGADTYYPGELVELGPNEVLVDCGSFDGDSIRMFLDRTKKSFSHIYAVEPDPKNRTAMESSFSSLSDEQQRRVTVLPFAVSDVSERVFFSVTGTAGSHISADEGHLQLDCRRLDDILNGPAPTFIKMDIEGAEPRAIRGATETIRKARPILAVCAYHRCEHLWTLPVLIKAALPEYSLFLRRYAEECWEMVYYAIPPERLNQKSSI